MTRSLGIVYVGGPTAVLLLGGLRLLTDPTFDEPGDYPIGARKLTKTIGAALSAEQVGGVDVILLSHDQHADNLDRLGREFLGRVPTVLSTSSAQQRIGGSVRALPNWESFEVVRPDGGAMLRITGVPAQHGPDGTEHLVGEVTGFVLSGSGLPTVYVSGDNASLKLVQSVADRFGPFDIALIFAGGAQTPLLGDAYLTLTSDDAAEAARILGARRVVPLHFEGWAHFTQGAQTLRDAFDRLDIADRLIIPSAGERLDLAAE